MGVEKSSSENSRKFIARVNGNWRLTFTFDGEDAILVDYQDYR
jgi:proteic killer suppression protein